MRQGQGWDGTQTLAQSGSEDSNLRLPAPKAGALPLSYNQMKPLT